MNITACSAFRSASSYLDRYFSQMAGLQTCLQEGGDSLHLILGEGDHADTTRFLLPELAAAFDACIVSFDHGGPDHGSVVHPVRFANMALIWNRIWAEIPEDADAVVFCEADLVWEPSTLVALIDELANMPAVSPLIILRRKGWPVDAFYDNWAVRKDGVHIALQRPYFDGWDMQEPIQVDSSGSCLAMRGDLARQVTWPPEDVVVGVCRQLYECGGSIYLHPGLEVTHL